MTRYLVSKIKEPFTCLPPSILILAAVTFINRSGTMVLPFATLYLTAKGWPPINVGFVISTYAAGAMLGVLVGGWFSDRVKPSYVLLMSLILTGAVLLVLETLHQEAYIILFFGLFGLVAEAFRPASHVAFSALAGENKQDSAFKLNRLAIHLGLSIGSVAGGFVAANGFKWLFWIDSATSLVAALVLWRFFQDKAPQRSHISKGWLTPAKDGPFLAFLGLYFILMLVYFQLQVTYPLVLSGSGYGWSKEDIGMALAINTMMVVLFETRIRVKPNTPRLHQIALGVLILGIGFGILPLGAKGFFVCATIVIWTIGEMLAFPLLPGVVAGRAGEKGRRGAYFSLYNICGAFSFIIAPIAGTWVIKQLGYHWLMYICGIMGVMLCLGFWRLRNQILHTEPIVIEPATPGA